MGLRAVAAHLRLHLVRGILLILPLVITIWLLDFLFGLISDNVTPWIMAFLRARGLDDIRGFPVRLAAPLVGIFLTFVLVYVIGLVAGNLAGRRVIELVESFLLKVPLVKGIYGAARQLLDAFKASGAGAFSRVVLVEYPRRGSWTLAFVTRELGGPALPSADPDPGGTLLLFLPTTPNPTSGWLLIVPARDVIDLSISVEEGIKLVVSGGIVSPSDLMARVRPPLEGAPARGEVT